MSRKCPRLTLQVRSRSTSTRSREAAFGGGHAYVMPMVGCRTVAASSSVSSSAFCIFHQHGQCELVNGFISLSSGDLLKPRQHGIRRFKPVEKTPEERQQELQKIDDYKTLEHLVSEKVIACTSCSSNLKRRLLESRSLNMNLPPTH